MRFEDSNPEIYKMFNRKTSPLCDVIATSLAREFLSDRKTLFTQLKPIRLFSLGATRMAIVVADHGNSLIERYSDDLDLLEAHQAAWLSPWETATVPRHGTSQLAWNTPVPRLYTRQGTVLPSAAMENSENGDEDDVEEESVVVANPWPELLRKTAYGTARDVSVIAVTWALEELALLYFTTETCDGLTKNAYLSGQRKMERNDSKLQTTQQFLTMHLKSSCLRWTAVFCVNATMALYKRLSNRGGNVADDACGGGSGGNGGSGGGSGGGGSGGGSGSGSGNGSGGRRSNGTLEGATPLHLEVCKHAVNQSVSWVIESCSAASCVLFIPLKYGGTSHAYTYTLMSQLGFGLGGMVIRKPIVGALFNGGTSQLG